MSSDNDSGKITATGAAIGAASGATNVWLLALGPFGWWCYAGFVIGGAMKGAAIGAAIENAGNSGSNLKKD